MIPTWIDQNEYPFKPNQFSLPMGTMSYVDEGSGEPIVMVHGNPTWSFVYRHLIKKLSPNYRCIAMDHIGFGLSDKPYDWSYRPQAHATNLQTFLDALDLDNITLIVQDWGGPIGLSYAINNPEKIKRLVILNTWMWPVNNDWYYRGFSGFMGGFLGRFLIRHFNFFAKVVVRMAFGDKSKIPAHIHDHYLNPLPTQESRKGSWVFPHEIIASSDWLAQLWAQHTHLTNKPTMLAWGMKDIAFREKELNRWITLFPQASVTRYAHAGHYVQEEKGAELALLVNNFIASVA